MKKCEKIEIFKFKNFNLKEKVFHQNIEHFILYKKTMKKYYNRKVIIKR